MMDPETNTADKCTYCAHRVEGGLEPACVVACPTEANVFGDLDEPGDGFRVCLTLFSVKSRRDTSPARTLDRA